MRRVKQFARKFMSVCLTMCVTISLFLTGCGNEAVEEVESIELHEPETGDEAAMNTEKVACRNLYRTQVYEGVVYPYVEEYSCESEQKFGSFDVVLGEDVAQGTPLVHMDAAAIDKKIESMEEQIHSLTDNFEKARANSEEKLAALGNEMENLQEILDNLEEIEPEEYIVDLTGQNTANPEYSSWQKEWKKWEGQFNNKELSFNMETEALRQKKELYELDYQYYSSCLRKLEEEKRAGILVSGLEGKVIAMGSYSPGSSVHAKTPVIAVGDMDRKYIKCSKIPELNRLCAQEMYAVAGGKRYEVNYVESNDSEFSLFSLEDEDNETKAGDAAVLVLAIDVREQAPTVSVESIHRDGLQQYVYVLEGDKVVTKIIQAGMSDGVYTEILSGVEAGEEVMVSQKLMPGANTAVLEKGTFEIAYGGNGSLVYPLKTRLYNPVEEGTVYFQEYKVAENQYVEKGDVVAVIRVESEGVELARKEINLKRAKERLADLIADGEEKNKDAIEQRQEGIAKLEEEIASIRKDYGTTEIYATASGRVYYLADYTIGDVLKPGVFLGEIADESVSFLELSNDSNYLCYGDTVKIAYPDNSGGKRTVEGMVATFGIKQGGMLAEKEVLVELPGGVLEDVQTARRTYSGAYVPARIEASAVLEKMKNVVMVPKLAVTGIEGNTYVNVLLEDGTVMPVSFLAGGVNREYYWVIDGLTEGTKICWE